MGFIGYRQMHDGSVDAVRIYLECQDRSSGLDAANEITCGPVVDVLFPAGAPCRLRGIEGVLVLKKFYKLVFSLEERAREHGNDWRSVMESSTRLLEHLRYTRNAREFTQTTEPRTLQRSEGVLDLQCAKQSVPRP